MAQKILLLADDNSYFQLSGRGEFPWLCKNIEQPEQILDEHQYPGCLRISPHWFSNTPETVRSRSYEEWETILGAMADRLICYLAVLNGDETDTVWASERHADKPSNAATNQALARLQQHVEFYRHFRKWLSDAIHSRESHARHLLILICQQPLTPDFEAAFHQALDGENRDLFDIVFLMTDKLEPTDEGAVLHSKVVWPSAVGNLLAVLLHENAVDPGTYVWRTVQVRVTGLDRHFEKALRQITEQFRQAVWREDTPKGNRPEEEEICRRLDIPNVANVEELMELWKQMDRELTALCSRVWGEVHKRPSFVAARAGANLHQPELTNLRDKMDRTLDAYMDTEDKCRLLAPSKFHGVGRGFRVIACAIFVVALFGFIGLLGFIGLRSAAVGASAKATAFQQAAIALVGLLLGLLVLVPCAAWVFLTRRDRLREAERLRFDAERERKRRRFEVAAVAAICQWQYRAAAIARHLASAAAEIYRRIDQQLGAIDAPRAEPVGQVDSSTGNLTPQQSPNKTAQWQLARYREVTQVNYPITQERLASQIEKKRQDVEQFIGTERERFWRDTWSEFWSREDPLRRGRYCPSKLEETVKQFGLEFQRRAQQLLLRLLLQREDEASRKVWQQVRTFLSMSNYLGTLSCEVARWRPKFSARLAPRLYLADACSPQVIGPFLDGIGCEPKPLCELIPSPPVIALVFEPIGICVGSRHSAQDFPPLAGRPT